MAASAGRVILAVAASGWLLAGGGRGGAAEETNAAAASAREENVVQVKIERNPSQARLDELGVFRWDTWTKEVSEFPWEYSAQEVCYFLEGEVVVTPDGGKPVTVGKGDLVTFPRGMKCTWDIRKGVRKHYRFEEGDAGHE